LEKDQLGDSVVDEGTILKWVLKKHGVRVWAGLTESGSASVAGSDDHEYVPSGSMKDGEFLDQINHCQVMRSCASWILLASFLRCINGYTKPEMKFLNTFMGSLFRRGDTKSLGTAVANGLGVPVPDYR
jgi:hypothetical protein